MELSKEYRDRKWVQDFFENLKKMSDEELLEEAFWLNSPDVMTVVLQPEVI